MHRRELNFRSNRSSKVLNEWAKIERYFLKYFKFTGEGLPESPTTKTQKFVP